MKFYLIIIFLSNSLFALEKPLITLPEDVYNENANYCCFFDWGFGGWINKNQKFPDAKVLDLETKNEVEIQSLIKSKPVVIQIGSVTCPSYHLNIPFIKEIEKKFAGKVEFYTLYTRENHPGNRYKVHKSLKQKIKYAKALSKLDGINHKILVDDVNGALHQALGNFGNSIYLIGKDQIISHWSMYAEPASLEKAIVNLLENKGNGADANFTKGSEIHPYTNVNQYTKQAILNTKKLMSERDMTAGAKKLSAKQQMESQKNEFNKSVVRKEIYASLDEQTKKSHKKLMEFFSKNSTEQTFEDFEKYFSEYQISFKHIYDQRLQNWTKGIQDVSK